MRPALPIAVAAVLVSSGCSCNLIPDPPKLAASVPQSANVAVGATHDVLIVACADKVTLTDFVFPVAATALFVGLGRLDAAFYLPGALAKAAIPQCDPVDFAVSGAKLEGSGFELEATMNPNAFKAHARSEGESTFTAQVAVGKEVITVSSTLTALTADRVEFAVKCDLLPVGAADAGTPLPGWVPSGGGADVTHRLFHGDAGLSGYGLYGVSHPRMTLTETRGRYRATFTAERGPFTVTSPLDPAFSLALTTYDATDFDPPSLSRVTGEHLFPGERTSVFVPVTIQGRGPCVAGFSRRVTVAPASVCSLGSSSTGETNVERSSAVSVEAVGPGTCRVTVTLGDMRSASLDIPVYRGFEVLAEVPDAGRTLEDMVLFTSSELHLTGRSGVGNTPAARGAAMRFTGGSFSPLQTFSPPTELFAVHGSDPMNVFAVGTSGFGARYDGTQWSVFDAGTGARLNAVWVSSPTDVYAAGHDGGFVHFDGAAWTPIDLGRPAWLSTLWRDSSGLLYVGGDKTLLAYDGGTFTNLWTPQLGDGGYFFGTGIAGTGAHDLWLIASTRNFGGSELYHFDGMAWTKHLDAGFLEGARAVVPMPAGYVYVLVDRGAKDWADRFDGTKWVHIPLPSGSRAMAASGNDIVVFTGARLMRYRHDPADVFP